MEKRQGIIRIKTRTGQTSPGALCAGAGFYRLLPGHSEPNSNSSGVVSIISKAMAAMDGVILNNKGTGIFKFQMSFSPLNGAQNLANSTPPDAAPPLNTQRTAESVSPPIIMRVI